MMEVLRRASQPPGGPYAQVDQTKRKKRVAIIRIAAILLIGAGLGVLALQLRPFKTLDVKAYQAVFPLTSAQSKEGSFIGFVDTAL